MERYGQVLLIAIPFFIALIIVEKIYGMWKGEDRTPIMDMVSSLMSGLTNAVKDVLGLSVSILSYTWLVSHWAIIRPEATWWMYVVTFIVLDFQGYWVHRWAHEINFFWNKHLIHHSSEEFNLPCALRQSISSFVNLFTFFLLPAALLGIPAIVVATIAPLHLFAQFWYHTRHIGKLGIWENIIVTPSHHRVHHAINPEYMDKNYSQVFIIWDKLFGTFQEELPEKPPVYGITRPAATWNPIKINFQHFWLMLKDAWYAANWKDKFRIWWKPTGWRPADVAARFPVPKISDVYHFEKYNPPSSLALQTWSVVHLAVLMLISAHFFGNIAAIGSPNIFLYGLFLFVSVYSMAELADRNPNAVAFDIIRVAMGFGIFWVQKDWFGLNQLIPSGSLLIMGYLIITLGMTLYCSFLDPGRNLHHSSNTPSTI
ncbi:MAG TPA: sterol desaturase family protein [Saprospiraceae bacterium]|nr:sterol desaturase family protein [Saprospiraceae bacterium]